MKRAWCGRMGNLSPSLSVLLLSSKITYTQGPSPCSLTYHCRRRLKMKFVFSRNSVKTLSSPCMRLSSLRMHEVLLPSGTRDLKNCWRGLLMTSWGTTGVNSQLLNISRKWRKRVPGDHTAYLDSMKQPS